ncbi:MAG: hypothetical protein JXA52_10225, partial [Planctomycetes bacterium]|nr:hypothetical protein [Planctomycetota bacterium]
WRVGLPVYWAWMGFSFVIGNITNFILLTVFYYLVITPIGLLMRLTGRDKLMLKKPQRDSYWCDVEQITNKSRYERQF